MSEATTTLGAQPLTDRYPVTGNRVRLGVAMFLALAGWGALVWLDTGRRADASLITEIRESGKRVDQLADVLAASIRQKITLAGFLAETAAGDARVIDALAGARTMAEVEGVLAGLRQRFDLASLSLQDSRGLYVAGSPNLPDDGNAPGVQAVSAPVQAGGAVVGTVTARVDLGRLIPPPGQADVHVVDAYGIVIAAEASHMLRTTPGNRLASLSPEQRQQRYGRHDLQPMSIGPWDADHGWHLLKVGDKLVPDVMAEEGINENGLAIQVMLSVPAILDIYTHRDVLRMVAFVAGAVILLLIAGAAHHWRRTRMDLAHARALQNALAESREDFGLIAGTVQDVFWTATADLTRITYLSPAYEHLWGRPRAVDDRPSSLVEGLHPDDQARVAVALCSPDVIGNGTEYEFRILRPDGTIRWARGRTFPVKRPSNRPAGYAGLISDMTEACHAADLARAKREAETANEAKTRFLATMSHEIRTPMNAVIGYCSLIMKTNLDQMQRDYINTIDTAAKLLIGVVGDILDFSKIEAGKLDLEVIRFDLHAALDAVIRVSLLEARKKGIKLQSELAHDVPTDINGDPLRLKQVLLNLLNNALKFTDHGEVVLSVSVAERKESGVTLSFSVRDTGIGISDDDQSRLFRTFSQGDISTARRHGGSGLGLVISRRICEMMGGTIGVASHLGQGSTFTFTARFALGAAAGESDKACVPAPAPGSLCGRHILLTEDSTINQKMLAMLLKREGLVVDVANNGREAVEIITNGRATYDAILMDIQMPEMDGLTATQLIRQHFPSDKLPIVALTALAMPDEKRRCLEAGMNDHVTKPIDPKVLLAALARCISVVAAGPVAGSLSPPPLPIPALPSKAALWPKEALFDSAQIARLLDCVGEDVVRGLLANLPDEMSRTIKQIQEAWDKGDISGIKSRAHRLKGDAANLGAHRVAVIAQYLNKECDSNGLAPTIDALKRACQETEMMLPGLPLSA